MSDTENRRIQQRHGTYSSFETDISNVLPDEVLIVDSGHPDTPDGTAFLYKTLSGNIKRVRNSDELLNVGEEDIQDGAVTEDKIAGGAVTRDKLASNSVTRSKIKAGEINQAKLDSELSDFLNKLKQFVPVISTSSGISSLSEGQLFIYNNNLARKTASSYQYVTRIQTTGGNVDQFTPYFIGQFYFINNKLYVGTSTSIGGYKEIELDNPTLKVQLTYDGTTEDLVADKTNKQIYDAMALGRNIVVYYTTSTQTNYYKLNFSRTESVPQGTVYRISISDSYSEVDYYSYGMADDSARFVRE